jgi:hypothetical protein
LSEDDYKTELNLRGLDQLIKALKKDGIVKVGILGDGSNRQEGGLTNAAIGAAHEFGKGNNPVRSWLRAPLMTKLGPEIEKAGILSKSNIKNMVATGSPLIIFKQIGVLGEAVIQEGFETGGYGGWKPSIMSRKTNHQTLVETQQLRNSVTSEVEIED